MRILNIIFCISIISISMMGCASGVIAPGGLNLPANGKVGLISLINNDAKHVHQGTTMFQNKVESLGVDWGLESYAVNYLNQKLGPSISVMKISPTQKIQDAGDLTSTGWSSFPLKESLKPDFRELANKYGLSAIIVLDSTALPAGDDSVMKLKGYGLYTVCKLKNCRSEAMNNVFVRVFSVNPPEHVGWGQYYEDRYPVRIDLSGLPESVSNADLETVKTTVLEILRKDIDSALEISGILQTQ